MLSNVCMQKEHKIKEYFLLLCRQAGGVGKFFSVTIAMSNVKHGKWNTSSLLSSPFSR